MFIRSFKLNYEYDLGLKKFDFVISKCGFVLKNFVIVVCDLALF